MALSVWSPEHLQRRKEQEKITEYSEWKGTHKDYLSPTPNPTQDSLKNHKCEILELLWTRSQCWSCFTDTLTKLSQNKFSWLTYNISYYRITMFFHIIHKMCTKCLVERWIRSQEQITSYWLQFLLQLDNADTKQKLQFKLYYHNQWGPSQLS